MYERNGIEAIVDNDGILRLNENHIEEGLGHKKLREISINDQSDHRKQRYELEEEPKKLVKITFIYEKLAIKELWIV